MGELSLPCSILLLRPVPGPRPLDGFPACRSTWRQLLLPPPPPDLHAPPRCALSWPWSIPNFSRCPLGLVHGTQRERLGGGLGKGSLPNGSGYRENPSCCSWCSVRPRPRAIPTGGPGWWTPDHATVSRPEPPGRVSGCGGGDVTVTPLVTASQGSCYLHPRKADIPGGTKTKLLPGSATPSGTPGPGSALRSPSSRSGIRPLHSRG